MKIQGIQEYLRAQPFRPFILVASDGREFLVKHPEFVEIDSDTYCVLIHDQAGNIQVLKATQIASIRVQERARTT